MQSNSLWLRAGFGGEVSVQFADIFFSGVEPLLGAAPEDVL